MGTFSPLYTQTSPYYYTPIFGRFQTYYIHRTVTPNRLDIVVTLTNERYNQRPDNLAQDLYGDAELFWVIPVRNGLEDPIYDLTTNRTYIIPHPSFVRSLV